MIVDPEAFLRDLFVVAVAAADPMITVPKTLPPKPVGRVVVIGAGKASARMAEAVEASWGPCEGYVITRYGYERPCQGIEIIQAAHPVPDAVGAAATQHLLDLVGPLGADDFVLALISGGGSALLTAPAGQISLAELQALNSDLLASGATIDQINIVRKHVSRIKGGQLAAAVYPAQMLALMISDVPGDDPAFIASGPTVGDRSTPQDARAILDYFAITAAPSISAVLHGQSGVLKPDDPRLAKTQNRVISAPSHSLAAAAEKAAQYGIRVQILGDALEGEARDLAKAQVAQALVLQKGMSPGDPPILLLSGGECTVSGRGIGVGGPNAEFTLAAAIALQGQLGITVLACDTDGVDGAAEVAGAIATHQTLARAKSAGVDANLALAAHDSHGFFARVDQQVVTGPTLTNVNDFRAILIEP